MWHLVVISKIKHSLLHFLQFRLKQVTSLCPNISANPDTQLSSPTSRPACLLSTCSTPKPIHALSPQPSPTLNVHNDFHTKNGKNPLHFHNFTVFFANNFQYIASEHTNSQIVISPHIGHIFCCCPQFCLMSKRCCQHARDVYPT